MKKFLVLTMIALFSCGVISACGGGGTEPGTDGDTQDTSETDVVDGDTDQVIVDGDESDGDTQELVESDALDGDGRETLENEADAETSLPDGDAESQADGDTNESEATEAESEEEEEVFEPRAWTDPTTGLIWQDPPPETPKTLQGATDFCDALELAGYDDWRLPNINELRTLIRGCPANVTGGTCGFTDQCLDPYCGNGCAACESLKGPAANGCYWPDELHGDCERSHMSSNILNVFEGAFVLNVIFSLGHVSNQGKNDGALFRCVRGAIVVPDGDQEAEAEVEDETEAEVEADSESEAPTHWTDSAARLIWQNPPAPTPLSHQQAVEYCAAFEGGGWRLPTINELRSLVRGCADTALDGGCGVTDACLDTSTCHNLYCVGCAANGGPDGGCYWPTELDGNCDDKFWSDSVDQSWYFDITFSTAGLDNYYYNLTASVRCVKADTTTPPGSWTDPASGLLWQNPPTPFKKNHQQAADYCQGLPGGDWRLPTIDELRSLVRGCPDTASGGACGVTDTCLDTATCHNPSCVGCAANGGLDGGCYWPTELDGNCADKFWSSSADQSWFFDMRFNTAALDNYYYNLSAAVRCVHDPLPIPGTWRDPVSKLTWQNPPTTSTFTFAEATAYCANLSLGGGGWHVPSFDDMRSLVRGCPNMQTGGSCTMTDTCATESCMTPGCYDSTCTHLGGPDGGCYWPSEIEGECNIYSWSSTTRADSESEVWTVVFSKGHVSNMRKDNTSWVRCVR